MSERDTEAAASYEALRRELRETELLSSIGALLSWDQETMMPPGATGLRAEQAATLSQMVHRRRTSARFGDLLSAAEEEARSSSDPEAAANLREIRRDFDHAVRIPEALVREITETSTHAQQAWKEARAQSEFPSFAPWLGRVVALCREKAQCLATDDRPELYDALLDLYEPDAKADEIAAAFNDLRTRLTPLIVEIATSGRRPGERIHNIESSMHRQDAFAREVAKAIGFDFDQGRLDASTHPFCQGVGPGDTRLTTRYRPDGFFDALGSTLHEAGHGLYEQGLPKHDRMGEPLGEAVSLGIHESQSRLWENFVGRSRAFWSWALPRARRTLAPSLDDVGLDEVYSGMNLVAPNLIRVESDEATYNLHIMLRFDLERALLSGDLAVGDLPGAWNDRIRADLGLDVPDDRRGCLQDIHWSFGAIGYFPTYTLGNLYAAQFWAAVEREIPDLEQRIAAGGFGELLDWLRAEIHVHGRRYSAAELCARVTGRPLSATPFVDYLNAKLRPLYQL